MNLPFGAAQPAPPAYWLTRFVFLRLLGLVYAVAFLIVLLQWEPLLGSRGLLALLSVNPVMNMLSAGQVMHTSFDPLDLVNTYGAFGSIGRERYEIVLEGTEGDPDDPETRWLEYDFKCKPGTPSRRPCWISPYHYRLDWQMWFLAMPGAAMDPWFVHLVAKLLEGNPAARGLLAPGPFGDRPPRAIRARYYRYQMTPRGSGDWWKRTPAGSFLPALTRDDPRLREYLAARGWR